MEPSTTAETGVVVVISLRGTGTTKCHKIRKAPVAFCRHEGLGGGGGGGNRRRESELKSSSKFTLKSLIVIETTVKG